jgi:hypothetical protein
MSLYVYKSDHNISVIHIGFLLTLVEHLVITLVFSYFVQVNISLTLSS